MKRKIGVIGSGFSSLSAACHLAKAGYEVSVFEKNSSPGGRARKFTASGYTFDMGPSWYWMPDVFEHFFEAFGKSPSDYYNLLRLDPSYSVKFQDETIDIPASMKELEALFESIEKGSSTQLRKFLKQAKYKYETGIKKLVYKPGRSLTEFTDLKLIIGLVKMDVFTSMSKYVRKFFKNEKLIQLMEFPVLFLGATPENTPALYSLMNYADMSLGTWYPIGGMHKIVEAMVSLATELGVEIHYDQEVKEFVIENNQAKKITTTTDQFDVDGIVAGADYHHIEQLLPAEYRNYSEAYWNKRTLAPSSLIFYLGINKKLPNLKHHVLFFDEDFKKHAEEIYTNPEWPKKPLIYVSTTSKTDPTVAPEGCENLMILIPVAPDLNDQQDIRDHYFDLVIDKLEAYTGTSIRENIAFQRSFAHSDFINDYHSFKGNAYGLANTLKQTATLKPSLKSKKIQNLYFTGQLTVPGPGVPPSIISGEVVSKEIIKEIPSTQTK